MGGIIEISPKVSVETRRESAAFIVDGAHADQDGAHPNIVGRLEFHYDKVFALKAAVEKVIDSDRFKTWLKKQEGR